MLNLIIQSLDRAAVIVLCVLLCACSGRKVSEYRAYCDVIESKITSCIERNKIDSVRILCRELRDMSEANSDEEAYMHSLFYDAQCYYREKGNIDSVMNDLDKVIAYGKQHNEPALLAAVYNLYAVNSLFNDFDYRQGLSYLNEGIRYATDADAVETLFALYGNMALSSYYRNDINGLEYALKLYELGKQKDREYMIFLGSVMVAYMYHLKGNQEEALHYLLPALPLTDIYGEKRGVYAIYGDILFAEGNTSDAAKWYLKATEDKGFGKLSDIQAYVGYGRCLCSQKKYVEAIQVLKEGMNAGDMSESRSPQGYALYKEMAYAYEMTGDIAEALKYYKLYNEESNILLNVRLERELGRQNLQYETEIYKVNLRLARRRLFIVFLLFIIVSVVALFIFVLEKKKEKNYQIILRQLHEASEKEKRYLSQLDRLASLERALQKNTEKLTDKSGGNIGIPAMQDDKSARLFDRIQTLMKSEKLYRRSDISRELLAGLLSSNRTYVSNAIADHTGLSFTYYVNSLRIEDAVSILSDTDKDVQIKNVITEVGFNSAVTFHRLFKAATGMTPAQFRKEKTGILPAS